jgi:hypothetical protein
VEDRVDLPSLHLFGHCTGHGDRARLHMSVMINLLHNSEYFRIESYILH